MTSLVKRICLVSATVAAVTAVGAAAVYTIDHISSVRTLAGALGDASVAVVHAAQDPAQGPGGQPPFRGRGGPGGPGRFGGPGGPPHLGPMGPAGIALNRLGLSDAQKDQAKAIMQAHQQDLKGLGDRERGAREALNAAVSADVMDEGAIRARAADVAAVEADSAVLQARIRAEVFQILTPDQQAQAKQMQTEMKQRLEERRQRGQGGAPARPR
jgi:Spy/CpxP family protein refolding chaperone